MGEQGTHGDIARELAQWRAFVSLREGVAAEDVDELEDHLLATVEDLTGRGLAGDEAFLVAVKRLGRTDAIAREFARHGHEAEPLARAWRAHYEEGLALFDAWGGDLVAPFARMAEEGRIEAIASAATHGFLPLLPSDAADSSGTTG